MKTTVVNINASEYDVYCGRAGRGETGYFGNPFRAENVGRDAAIAMFRRYFKERISSDAEFERKVQALRGKRLGCFCKPLSCHCDVYVEYLETGGVK